MPQLSEAVRQHSANVACVAALAVREFLIRQYAIVRRRLFLAAIAVYTGEVNGSLVSRVIR